MSRNFASLAVACLCLLAGGGAYADSETGETEVQQVSRAGASVTRLADGRVLIAGGEMKAAAASAEIYDPQKERFTATSPMIEGRANHTATLLPDGKVLIVGGERAPLDQERKAYNPATARIGAVGVPLASAELYDPATGKFRSAGRLAIARTHHTATLLANGKVLITGGSGDNQKALASAELYDPATGTFGVVGSMLAARSYHTATLLPNGKVLIAGGDAAEDAEDPGNRQAGSTAPPRIPAELYDPISAKFGAADQIGVMLAGRVGHSATLLRNGDVLITGGCVNGGMTPSTLYSPKTGKFRGVPGPAGCGSTATLLPDGTVLIVGGTDPNEMSGGILDDSAIYDPKNGRLSAAGTIPGGRTGHRAVLLKNGKVLIVGGFEGIGTGGAPADTTVLYDSIIHQYATLTP